MRSLVNAELLVSIIWFSQSKTYILHIPIYGNYPCYFANYLSSQSVDWSLRQRLNLRRHHLMRRRARSSGRPLNFARQEALECALER